MDPEAGTVADIADDSATSELSPLRDQAVARSLDGARARAEERVQRFLDAASELILEKGGLDFTVQDVVERSTQSLRSFYQFFDGKQHLLLAVYEDAIRAAGDELGRMLDEVDEPLERLHLSIVTIFDWSAQDPSAATPSPHLTVRSMAAFVFELLVTDRDAVVSATEPLFTHVMTSLQSAADCDAVEVDELRTTAAFLLQTTMFNAFGTAVISDAAERQARAEEHWQLLLNGLAAR